MTYVATTPPLRTTDGPILEIHDVHKRFGGLVVLDGVSFDVPRGAVTSLIGPNGSGKSTLLNIVTGVLRADHGDVVFAGESIDRVPSHRRAGAGIPRTFQTMRLFQEVTAVENVMVGAHVHARAGLWHSLLQPRSVSRENEALAERSSRALTLVGLAPAKHHVTLGKLTITDQRAVELARALVGEPSLLVLDEPTGGLDGSRLDEWVGVLGAVRADLGLAILLVEHRMQMVMRISDHVVALHAGHLIARGTPSEVLDDLEVRRVYLGEPDADG